MRAGARLIAVMALLCMILSGCGGNQSDHDRTQQLQPHILLELPEDFISYSTAGYPAYVYSVYGNGNIFIQVHRSAQRTSLEDYVNQEAEYYRAELSQKDGFWTLFYEDVYVNEPQSIINVYYEHGGYIWMVQGYCPTRTYEESSQQIWQYITGAEFIDN